MNEQTNISDAFMIYQTSRIIISNKKYPVLFSETAGNCALSKNLYNATLFRIRNHFTARNKTKQGKPLTELERQVELEIEETLRLHPGRIGSVISYGKLEKLMRVTKNPDFFVGLPMQTAQNVLKQAVGDFKNWLSAVKAYKQNPEKFTGVPKMPGYKKSKSFNYTISNQDAVLYSDEHGRYLKLPKTKEVIRVPHLPKSAVLKEVEVKPYYNGFVYLLTVQHTAYISDTEMPHIAAIDFGVNNIAALVTNEGHALLYKGGAIKSENQWFNKKKASLVSALTIGRKTVHYEQTNQLCNVSRNRDLFLRDQMHKISRSIINFCVEHKIGTLVMGVNKGWKQNANIGKTNNQNFVSIPYAMLRAMLSYKGEQVGITVLEQEESYTSKADFLSFDDIPVYSADDKEKHHFSGKRESRGIYKSSTGVTLNADINGAANILRKAVPSAFSKDMNFTYLQNPRIIGFHVLNHQLSA